MSVLCDTICLKDSFYLIYVRFQPIISFFWIWKTESIRTVGIKFHGWYKSAVNGVHNGVLVLTYQREIVWRNKLILHASDRLLFYPFLELVDSFVWLNSTPFEIITVDWILEGDRNLCILIVYLNKCLLILCLLGN